MAIINKYPYTDFHELNLDWFLEEFNKLNDAFDQVKAEVISMDEAIDEFRHWFETLDVSQEISDKIDRMIADGSFQAIVDSRLDPVVRTELDAQIPQLVDDWMDANITQDPTTVIDSSLSVRGAAADAFAAGLYAKTLSDNNCFDYLVLCDHTDTTSHGVSCTFNSDGSVSLDGTASNGNAMFNLFFDQAALPSWMAAGETYYGYCTMQNDVIFEVYSYHSGAFQAEWRFNSVTEPYPFTIPSDADGLLIRLRVLDGTTVHRTVKIHINSGLTNAQLSAAAGDNLQYKGIWPNNDSLDNVQESGIYLLTGNSSAPGSGYGLLYHIVASANIKTQTVYRFTTLGIFYRRWLYGSGWNNWTSLDSQSELVNPHPCKYVAFGDSLVQGALWNDDGHGGHVTTYADDNMKIPYRIANAVHATDFVNLAVGGMGYVNPTYAQPFSQFIQSQAVQDQISAADLITIELGVNDGDYTLLQIETGLRAALQTIRTLNPKCAIMLIQATPFTSNNQPFSDMTAGGWNLRLFWSMIDDVAVDFDCIALNWNRCRIVYTWSDYSGADGNWAHPKTQDVYYQMGNFMGAQVSQYFQN